MRVNEQRGVLIDHEFLVGRLLADAQAGAAIRRRLLGPQLEQQ